MNPNDIAPNPAERLSDPIEMEVFTNRLLSITEDMNNTLVRSSFSTNIKERKDCSVALFDAAGRLVAQGTQIHVAVWPGSAPDQTPPAPKSMWARQLLLSRAFASQAGSYVILAAGLRSLEDYPERYRELATFEYTGDSCIIDPRGEVIAGPVRGETILTARVSLEAVFAGSSSLR